MEKKTETTAGVTPPAQPSIEELKKENEALRAKLANVNEDSDIIKEKMRAGLTREQAIEVVRSQNLWDEQLAKEAAEKKADEAKK